MECSLHKNEGLAAPHGGILTSVLAIEQEEEVLGIVSEVRVRTFVFIMLASFLVLANLMRLTRISVEVLLPI
jgi:hypothetical protein